MYACHYHTAYIPQHTLYYRYTCPSGTTAQEDQIIWQVSNLCSCRGPHLMFGFSHFRLSLSLSRCLSLCLSLLSLSRSMIGAPAIPTPLSRSCHVLHHPQGTLERERSWSLKRDLPSLSLSLFLQPLQLFTVNVSDI